MVEIIPAVMPESLDDLRDKLARVEGLVPLVQIDVMDGKFTRSRNWPYTTEGIEEFRQILEGAEGMPFWNSLDFEIDLMVQQPEEIIDGWIEAGARRLIVHMESTDRHDDIIDSVVSRFAGLEELGRNAVEIGLALNIGTSNALVEPFLDRINFVQFMGIEQIGYQGQPFDERVLQKIVDLRRLFPDVCISVDGGVNFETAPLLIEAGAKRLVVGSALFESDLLEETLKDFQSLDEEGP